MSKHMMRDNAEPVIDNPDRPEMGAGAELRKEAAMSSGVEGTADIMEAPADTGRPSMDPVGVSTPSATPSPMANEMAETTPRFTDGYIRLVMDYRDGQLKALSATLVDGRLDKPGLGGQWSYQALVDGRVVSIAGLPDLLTTRGLAPSGSPEQGHSIGRRNAADFVVRIPKEEVTIDDFQRLTIELTQQEGMAPPEPGVTVQEQAAAAGEPIPQTLAVMDGLDLSMLDPGEARRLEEGLGQ